MNIVVRFLIINHIVVFYILQVFKEASTYRQDKDICKKTFLQYYGDMLGVDKFIESQVTYQDNIAYKIQELIGKPSLFYYGPDDIHLFKSYLYFESRGEKVGVVKQASSSSFSIVFFLSYILSSFALLSLIMVPTLLPSTLLLHCCMAIIIL